MNYFVNQNERRAYARFQSNTMVQFFIKKHSTRYMDCSLVDVSRNGIGIRVPHTVKIDTGMDVSLEITVPGSLERMTVAGRVHRVQHDDTMLAGIKFDVPLEQDVLDKLILR